jgi:hypothetical protein
MESHKIPWFQSPPISFHQFHMEIITVLNGHIKPPIPGSNPAAHSKTSFFKAMSDAQPIVT